MRHTVARCDADVAWVGRRAPDAEIEAKLNAVAALGRRPRYSDASDETASADAVQRMQSSPGIDGVAHSALVLQDETVRGMDDAVFRQGLAARVGLGGNLQQGLP